MLTNVVKSVNAVIEHIKTDYPDNFPNNPVFLNELEIELKYFIEDGEIDSWSILTNDNSEMVLTINKNNNSEQITIKE